MIVGCPSDVTANTISTCGISAEKTPFEEGIKGSLTPGKLGDITVLSKDILTCPEEEIRSAEVLYTIVGGKILYRKGS